MDKIMMILIAAAALLGGIDRIFHNRSGLGDKAEKAFTLMGDSTCAMAGILFLAPLLSEGLYAITPVFHVLGFDPAIAGAILACDMGGYDIACGLADNTVIASFSGMISASMLGCTISFTIPIGMGMVKDRTNFAKGILIGIVAMPVGILIGGIALSMKIGLILWQMLPILLFSALICLGLLLKRELTIRLFKLLAAFLRILGIVGITLAAVQYISGYTLIENLMSMNDVLVICGLICIFLLGALPLAEIFRRLLRKPLSCIGKRFGMNENDLNGLLMSPVSVVAVFSVFDEMSKRGKIVNAAASVCVTAAIGDQLGYVAARRPDLILPFLAGKFAGSVAGIAIALFLTGNRRKENNRSKLPETNLSEC